MPQLSPLSDEEVATLLEYQNRRVRNVEAYERSLATRHRIQALIEQHPPLRAPLTAKAVLSRLPDLQLSIRAVQWHMKAIRSGG